MLNKTHIPPSDPAQLRVPGALGGGERTWQEVQPPTDFNNDYLGILLGEPPGRRTVKAGRGGDVRVYRLARG